MTLSIVRTCRGWRQVAVTAAVDLRDPVNSVPLRTKRCRIERLSRAPPIARERIPLLRALPLPPAIRVVRYRPRPALVAEHAERPVTRSGRPRDVGGSCCDIDHDAFP